MKNIFAFFVFSILALPAAALAVDYGGPYTEPACEPPACNVAAPINVGASLQDKIGSLRISNALVSLGLFTYSPTASLISVVRGLSGYFGPGVSESGLPGAGKVLASVDSRGNAFWVSLSSLCSSTGACSGGGLAPGTVQGQTIYWDKVSNTWKNSVAVFITNSATGKQSLQIGNVVPNSAGDSFYVAGNSNFQGKVKINTPTSASSDKNGDVLTLIDATTGEADWKTPAAGSGPGSTSPWTVSGNNIYNNNSGPVGIGTGQYNINSSYKLQVEGGVSVSKDNFLTFGNGLPKNSSQDASINMTPLGTGVNSLDLQGGYVSVAPYVGRLIRMFDIVQVGTAVYVDKICNRLGQNCRLVDNFGLPTGNQGEILYYNNGWKGTNALSVSTDVSIPSKILTTADNLNVGTLVSNPKSLVVSGGAFVYSKLGIGGGTGAGLIPSAELDVNGQMRMRGGSPAAKRVITTDDNTGLARWADINTLIGSSDIWAPSTADANNIYNKNSGLVGIGLGPTGVPTAKLDVGGRIHASGKIASDVGFETAGGVTSGTITLNNNNTDGGRLIWNGGGVSYRARVGANGSLDFFPTEGGATTLGLSQDGWTYVQKLQAPTGIISGLTAGSVTANGIRLNTGAGANKILVSDAEGDATWQTLSTVCTATGSCGGGGSSLPAGTAVHQTLRWGGSAWSPSSALTNTGVDVGVQRNLTVASAIISNGQICFGTDCRTAWPAASTYTAGSGISITGSSIANTRALSLSGNVLSLTNGGGSVTLPNELPTALNNQTVYYNNGWKVNPYFTIDSAGAAIFQGSVGSNSLLTKALQVTTGVGSSKVGQVLMANDTNGTAIWKDLSGVLPANASINDTLRFDGATWVKNSGLVSDGSVVSVGPLVPSSATEKLRVTGGIRTDDLVVAAKKGVVGLQLDTDTQGTNVGGQVLVTDDARNARWRRLLRSAMFDNVSIDKGGSKNLITYTVSESNALGARDFAIMTCPSGYTAIGGGAICGSGHELSANGPGDTDQDWRVSCGDELGFMQRIKVSCAYGVEDGN